MPFFLQAFPKYKLFFLIGIFKDVQISNGGFGSCIVLESTKSDKFLFKCKLNKFHSQTGRRSKISSLPFFPPQTAVQHIRASNLAWDSTTENCQTKIRPIYIFLPPPPLNISLMGKEGKKEIVLSVILNAVCIFS